MKGNVLCILCLCAVLWLTVDSAPLASEPISTEPPYVFLDSWGNEIGLFRSPRGVAIGGDRVYVADVGNNRIQVFDLHGVPLMSFGQKGSNEGEFGSPYDAAMDSDNCVYVADALYSRIQKFTADGVFVRQWPNTDDRDGYTGRPRGIAVDSRGHVYVVGDYSSSSSRIDYRILKFTSDGLFVTGWGNTGSGDGELSCPGGLDVDTGGNVYVADTGNHRVQKFTSEGIFVTKWGNQGVGDGEFDSPEAITVDGSSGVYVADTENHRIQKFTSNGGFVLKWGELGTGDGQLDHPNGLAVDRNGDVYAADAWNNRLQKFHADGTFATKWGRPPAEPGQFSLLQGIAVDRFGNLYVADTYHHRVQRFTMDGAFLNEWGSYGSWSGQFIEPEGIAVDLNGNVYVADSGNNRIQSFTCEGSFLTQWGELGSGAGQFDTPKGLALDDTGNVYVADTYNHRIQKFTRCGSYLTQWGGEGDGDGQLGYPWDVALDTLGQVYVADRTNFSIQKFTTEGEFLAQWGGSGDVGFRLLEAITVDNNGNVHVVDYDRVFFPPPPLLARSRILQLSSKGELLAEWTSHGDGEGQICAAGGIAADVHGNIYVADTYNYRIQKFAPDYPSPDPVHGLALNGSFEETPNLVRWAYGGELPVSLVNDASHGTYAAQLGEPTPQTEHDQGMAWLRQTIYVRPEWERPSLTFRYRMFVNDIIDYSDFHVWLTRSNGAWLADVLRDGFRSCTPGMPPPAGYDLGWRTAGYDLSSFKGQTVRLVFENRNLHSGYSWGIWSYVDDVRVVDAGPAPVPVGPELAYLPFVAHARSCDPVVVGLGTQSTVRPSRP